MLRMHDPTPPWDPSAVMEVEAATVQDARHGRGLALARASAQMRRVTRWRRRRRRWRGTG